MSAHNVIRAYKVTQEFSGRGLEKTAYICVQDQYGTIWQDRQISRDEFMCDANFYKAVQDKYHSYKRHWEKGE